MRKSLGFAAMASVMSFAPFTLVQGDQVFNDDVIVDGSQCVGLDCVNGESFGFDTIRLKENNLRIHFDDTSSAAAFPRNDWRIVINDSANGGGSFFAIDDATGNRRPFLIEAGAPNNSLFVEDSGDIGLGTANPVVELHIVSGDTPTARLEQDGSSGFTPQTWDLAGNETNFFVRDVTNGSRLPFRIRPNAPTSSIDIATDGDVGMGTASPDAALHVSRTNADATVHLVASTSGRASLHVESLGSDVNSTAVADFENVNNDGRIWRIGQGVGGAFFMATDDDSNTGGLATNLFTLNAAGNLLITGTISSGGQVLTVPDYVLKPDYALMPMGDLAKFIEENHHLPDIPSEADIKAAGGVNMTEMQMKLLEKVEQLTLYTLEQQKVIDALTDRMAALERTKTAGR